MSKETRDVATTVSVGPAPDYDAIISGFGPTGGVLAGLLAKGGLSVLLVEQAVGIYDKPRAIGLDHEVLRTLQHLGIADELFPLLLPYPGTKYLGMDGEVIKVLGHQPPPYPLGWITGASFIQPELEAVLRRHIAADPGIRVLLSHRLEGFEQDENLVSAEITDLATATSMRVRGRYLLACDGASSAVRKALGIGHDDQNFDERWLVVDAWLHEHATVPVEGRQYCWPSRPATYVVGPRNLRRWEMKLLPHERAEEFQTEESVKQALAAYVSPDDIDIWRNSVYRFHALVATEWRRTRIFLLGDAAHQTPPFMGQGMCSGIRDAANLAWKLLMVERQGARPELLDTYQAEMKPHVSALIDVTKGLGLVIGELDPHKAKNRDDALRGQMLRGEAITVRSGFMPPLKTGVIDASCEGTPLPAAGTLFVQPFVAVPDGTPTMLEDLLGPQRRFLLVSAGHSPQTWLRPEDVALWLQIDGERVAITDPAGDIASLEGVVGLVETEGVFHAWISRAGAAAAIVRPDRYVYGVAATPSDLHRMLDQLRRHVLPPARPETIPPSIFQGEPP